MTPHQVFGGQNQDFKLHYRGTKSPKVKVLKLEGFKMRMEIIHTCGMGLLSLKWLDIFLSGSSSQHQFSSIWLGASTKSRSTLGKKGGVKIITYHRILSRGRSTLTSGDVHLYMQLKYSLRCLRLKQENSASFFTPRPTYYCSKTHQKTKKLSQ